MGRKRNDAERNRIQSIAFNLFRASGYNETSFTDIANASGAKRSLVQYYFPKKENLIYIYINKALDLASEMVEGNPFVTDPIKKLHLIGYLEYMALYKDNQADHLIKDILQDRDNTQMAIDRVVEWSIRYLGSEDEAYNRQLAEALTYAVGGGCELIYRYVVKGEVDQHSPKEIAERSIQIMDFLMGRQPHAINLDNQELEQWVKEKVRIMNKRMYL